MPKRLLTPETPLALVLADRLNELERRWVKNESSALKGEPEGIHQVRVAARRIRSLLTAFEAQLPTKEARWAGRALKQIARPLGSVRNIDVSLELLAELGINDAEALHRRWESRRAEQMKAARKALKRKRVDEVFSVLERIPKSPEAKLNLRVCDVLPPIAWSAYGEIRSLETELDTMEPARLHEVRIAGKRLRYVFDAFKGILPTETTDQLLEPVVAMQDELGRMQDIEVALLLCDEPAVSLILRARHGEHAENARRSIRPVLEKSWRERFSKMLGDL